MTVKKSLKEEVEGAIATPKKKTDASVELEKSNVVEEFISDFYGYHTEISLSAEENLCSSKNIMECALRCCYLMNAVVQLNLPQGNLFINQMTVLDVSDQIQIKIIMELFCEYSGEMLMLKLGEFLFNRKVAESPEIFSSTPEKVPLNMANSPLGIYFGSPAVTLKAKASRLEGKIKWLQGELDAFEEKSIKDEATTNNLKQLLQYYKKENVMLKDTDAKIKLIEEEMQAFRKKSFDFQKEVNFWENNYKNLLDLLIRLEERLTNLASFLLSVTLKGKAPDPRDVKSKVALVVTPSSEIAAEDVVNNGESNRGMEEKSSNVTEDLLNITQKVQEDEKHENADDLIAVVVTASGEIAAEDEEPEPTGEVRREPYSTGHCVLMMGLPDQAVEHDLFEFFKPLKPVSVRILYESSGRPSGKADVEFFSLDEAVKAMNKDKDKIQQTHIKLFMCSESFRPGMDIQFVPGTGERGFYGGYRFSSEYGRFGGPSTERVGYGFPAGKKSYGPSCEERGYNMPSERPFGPGTGRFGPSGKTPYSDHGAASGGNLDFIRSEEHCGGAGTMLTKNLAQELAEAESISPLVWTLIILIVPAIMLGLKYVRRT